MLHTRSLCLGELTICILDFNDSPIGCRLALARPAAGHVLRSCPSRTRQELSSLHYGLRVLLRTSAHPQIGSNIPLRQIIPPTENKAVKIMMQPGFKHIWFLKVLEAICISTHGRVPAPSRPAKEFHSFSHSTGIGISAPKQIYDRKQTEKNVNEPVPTDGTDQSLSLNDLRDWEKHNAPGKLRQKINWKRTSRPATNAESSGLEALMERWKPPMALTSNDL